MWQLLWASQNLLFSMALMLMLMIAFAEVAALMIGQSLSDGIDSLLPDTLVNPHTEVGLVDGDSALSKLLGWLRIGKVPILMLLVVFLLNFGLLGLLLQGLANGLVGFYLPGVLAVAVALLISLYTVRFWGGVLERVMPGDETTAVSEDSLVGRVGVITLGTARSSSPAEAKVKDEHGYSHYLRVIPDNPGQELPQGSNILTVARDNGLFRVIENSNPFLNESPDQKEQ